MPADAAVNKPGHIRLTSHPPTTDAELLTIHWGARDTTERGPVVGTTTNRLHRNVIGTHSGSYGVYRALAVAAKALPRGHRADLTNTLPTAPIGPYPQWFEPDRIVSLDPFGGIVADVYRDQLAKGFDIRPTIAVTQARIDIPEVRTAMATKVAIEPVWWLPGVARRFGVTEADLRRALFEETGGMYPELVTRSDL